MTKLLEGEIISPQQAAIEDAITEYNAMYLARTQRMQLAIRQQATDDNKTLLYIFAICLGAFLGAFF